MEIIDGNQSVYQLVKENPSLKEVLVNLGFTPLNNEKMLQSLGRMMSLNDGMKQMSMDRKEIEKALLKENYQLKN